MAKTRDGIKLSKILDVAREVEGVTIRDGRNHPYVLNRDGLRPCPVAESTDARKMLVPWFRQATGYETKTVYQALQKGSW
jgi:hypothetical protein